MAATQVECVASAAKAGAATVARLAAAAPGPGPPPRRLAAATDAEACAAVEARLASAAAAVGEPLAGEAAAFARPLAGPFCDRALLARLPRCLDVVASLLPALAEAGLAFNYRQLDAAAVARTGAGLPKHSDGGISKEHWYTLLSVWQTNPEVVTPRLQLR